MATLLALRYILFSHLFVSTVIQQTCLVLGFTSWFGVWSCGRFSESVNCGIKSYQVLNKANQQNPLVNGIITYLYTSIPYNTSYYNAPCPTAPSLKSLKNSSVNPPIHTSWDHGVMTQLLWETLDYSDSLNFWLFSVWGVWMAVLCTVSNNFE